MDRLIDFSSCRELVNTYEGANIKTAVIYEGERYMLKFSEPLEAHPKDPNRASKINTPISEYLGSHIFGSIGVPSQDTLLGTYKGRDVVACKDFIYSMGAERYELVEFNKLETSFFGSSTSLGRTPHYENIVNVLHNHPALEPIREQAERRYWEMFIGDALLGNFDRHAGNWGYILDKDTQSLIDLAAIYDCGATLYPKLDEEAMLRELASPGLIEKRILAYPKATIIIDGKKPSYHDFLLSPQGERCREVLLDMHNKIDPDSITELIENTPGLSQTRKEFYSTLIEARHEQIVLPAYEKVRAMVQEQNHSKTPSLSQEARDAREASGELAQDGIGERSHNNGKEER